MPRKPKAVEVERIHGAADLRELADTVLMMEAWCKAVRELLVSQVSLGTEIPGVTLEPTFSNREWVDDEDEVIAALKGELKRLGFKPTQDMIAPRKVLSPAGVEKLTGKPVFKEHLADLATTRPTGNYTLKIGTVTQARKSLLTKA